MKKSGAKYKQNEQIKISKEVFQSPETQEFLKNSVPEGMIISIVDGNSTSHHNILNQNAQEWISVIDKNKKIWTNQQNKDIKIENNEPKTHIPQPSTLNNAVKVSYYEMKSTDLWINPETIVGNTKALTERNM